MAKPAREPLLKNLKGPAGPEVSLNIEVNTNKIEVWNDEHFRKMRKAFDVSDKFLNTPPKGSRESVNLTQARAEASLGKGGHGQFESFDKKVIVKSISGDDHKALLDCAEQYAEHVLAGKSLLVPIFLHFREPGAKTVYIAMLNLTKGAGPWAAKYDLKGCNDDKTIEREGRFIKPVRRRFYNPKLWCSCLWTPERWTYYNGKVSARKLELTLPTEVRDTIVERIENDCRFLIDRSLMDYSLFVAIRRVRAADLENYGAVEAPPGRQGNLTFAYRDGEHLMVLSVAIIDFLQPWTPAKEVARCIKTLETNKATIPPIPFGERFAKHFAAQLKGTDTLQVASAEDAARSVYCSAVAL